MKQPRAKKRHLLLSLAYRLKRWLPGRDVDKLKLFLDLEWICHRFCHELSFGVYPPADHPVRLSTRSFLEKHMRSDFSVLDLGCDRGELGYFISKMVKSVVGVELESDSVREANRAYGSVHNLQFVNSEARNYLETVAEPFDVLLLSHILEHLDEPGQFLSDHVRHFRFVYIEVPDFEMTYLNQYRQRLGRQLIYTDADHVNEFTRDEMNSLLADNALELVDAQYKFGVMMLWCKVLHPR